MSLAVDDGPRDTAVPEDLAAALHAAGGTAPSAALAPGRRKAHVAVVEGVTSPGTRQRRIATVVDACWS